MRDHDDLYEGPHSGRAHIAELLDERRARISDDIVARLRRCDELTVSPIVVRTLVHALARSIAESSPEILVHWSRMVHHAFPAPVVVAMIDTACEVTEELAHTEHADVAMLVVFLEIVRSSAVSLAGHDLPAAASGEPALHTAIESLLAMLRARDDATCTHSRATGEWARRIALRMGLGAEIIDRVAKAGVLHDIGKIRVPDSILFKPGPLDESEWSVMKQHAEAGAEILAQIPALALYAPIVGSHHEWFDGRGYPRGLRREEISLEARIVAVADSFHAMTSERPYRRPLSYGEAIAVFGSGRGTQWDPEIADVMIALAAEDRTSSADANLTALSTSFFGDRLRDAQSARDLRAM
jgi:HD-GYP domain-containing protein (c-di-GMP phosphodiesterase class II)